MPNPTNLPTDLSTRLHRITKITNIEADLDKRFSDPRPEFDSKIHALPAWEELSMDTEDVELEVLRRKWDGVEREWGFDWVKEWSVNVGKAIGGVGDKDPAKTRSDKDPDTQNTDSTGGTNKQSSNVENKSKRGLSEPVGDEPVKRRRVAP